MMTRYINHSYQLYPLEGLDKTGLKSGTERQAEGLGTGDTIFKQQESVFTDLTYSLTQPTSPCIRCGVSNCT